MLVRSLPNVLDERTEFEKGIESMEFGLPLTLFPRRIVANNKVSKD